MASVLKTQYDTQGFVIVPDLVPESSFADLQAAAERAIGRTRAGKWSLRRTVGRQFPPFDESNPDSWGVQHVMHPELGEPAFSTWYTSDGLVKTATELMACDEEELQMELFNMLINPEAHDFALRWHRDDVRENAAEEEEQAALAVWHYGVQWNTALYEDSCLYVVPGSHKTARTPEQRVHSCTLDPPKDPLAMPGAIRVVIKAGESVFYNSNILHCATYDSTRKRATLHGTMGCIRGGSSRARNVLQHGLNWMTEDRFKNGLSARGKAMLEKLIKLKEGAGDVGYSLAN